MPVASVNLEIVIPAKAEVLYNSEAGQPSDLAFDNMKSLGPRLRGDDDQKAIQNKVRPSVRMYEISPIDCPASL